MSVEVSRLNELVQYQSGTVISKTLIKKDTGTVTLFAFDKGEGLSSHVAPFEAMVQVIDGEAKITISGTAYLLKAGEMIIMPAGEPHELLAIEKFKMILTMVRS